MKYRAQSVGTMTIINKALVIKLSLGIGTASNLSIYKTLPTTYLVDPNELQGFNLRLTLPFLPLDFNLSLPIESTRVEIKRTHMRGWTRGD